MTPKEICEQYEVLLKRALLVIEGDPYNAYLYNEEYASLRIDGDEATVFSFKNVRSWEDSIETERQGVTFHVDLLTMSDDDFQKWKADQKYLGDLRRKGREEAMIYDAALREREMYERLKRKYG